MEAGPSGIRGSVTLRKKDSVAAILGAPLEAGERDSFRMSQLIKPGTPDVRPLSPGAHSLRAPHTARCTHPRTRARMQHAH